MVGYLFVCTQHQKKNRWYFEASSLYGTHSTPYNAANLYSGTLSFSFGGFAGDFSYVPLFFVCLLFFVVSWFVCRAGSLFPSPIDFVRLECASCAATAVAQVCCAHKQTNEHTNKHKQKYRETWCTLAVWFSTRSHWTNSRAGSRTRSTHASRFVLLCFCLFVCLVVVVSSCTFIWFVVLLFGMQSWPAATQCEMVHVLAGLTGNWNCVLLLSVCFRCGLMWIVYSNQNLR